METKFFINISAIESILAVDGYYAAVNNGIVNYNQEDGLEDCPLSELHPMIYVQTSFEEIYVKPFIRLYTRDKKSYIILYSDDIHLQDDVCTITKGFKPFIECIDENELTVK